MKILNSFTLKIMAIIFMVMDHIYTYMTHTEYFDVPIWFGYVGKLAAPIFFYLIVEGFFHTRSREKYMIRLFSMGIVMMIVDSILRISNNIFLSLGAGVLLMYASEYAKKNKADFKKCVVGIMGAVVSGIYLMVMTEASVFGLAMILIFYFLREKKIAMSIVYVAFGLFWVLTAIGPEFLDRIFVMDYQWMMLFAIIPILMYNGKLGLSNKFIRWLFYWFYPIHLVVILIIGSMINVNLPVQQEGNTQTIQETVKKIDAKINFVDSENISYTLAGDFKKNGVYVIVLYDEETKSEIASKVEQVQKSTNVLEGKLKVLSERKSTIKVTQGKSYILSVEDINENEIIFENQVTLE